MHPYICPADTEIMDFCWVQLLHATCNMFGKYAQRKNHVIRNGNNGVPIHSVTWVLWKHRDSSGATLWHFRLECVLYDGTGLYSVFIVAISPLFVFLRALLECQTALVLDRHLSRKPSVIKLNRILPIRIDGRLLMYCWNRPRSGVGLGMRSRQAINVIRTRNMN